ncbi:hypothetical protein N9Y42_08420 [Mariniblastus sp.]|nr:hypothetical protein [Mariniblastus sp.]
MFIPPNDRRAVAVKTKIIVLLFICIAAIGCGTLEPEDQTESKSTSAIKVHEVAIAEENTEEEPTQTTAETDVIFVKTAEEYMSQFDDPTWTSWYEDEHVQLKVELPETELKKVVDNLKARFPLESIRDRMSFQMKTTSTDLENLHSSRDRRTQALSQLHSDKTTAFINSQGQGFPRFNPIAPSDLKRYEYKYATKIDAENVGSELLSEPLVQLEQVAGGRACKSALIERTSQSARCWPL